MMKKKTTTFQNSQFADGVCLWQTICGGATLLAFPAPSFIGFFLDSPARRFLQPTKQVLQRSGLKKGMQVLEVGCGNGAYIPAAARMVGPKGIVHASIFRLRC